MSYADYPCQKAVTVLTEYLESALGVEDQAVLERHLAWCDWCATYLNQLRDTARAARSLQEPSAEPAPELVDNLLARFRATRRR